jgi:hypothetical protein
MNVLDSLFGPIGKQYCSLFYYLSIISFTMYVGVVVGGLFHGVSSSKGLSYYLAIFWVAVVYLIGYFQNRLLFSMCSR